MPDDSSPPDSGGDGTGYDAEGIATGLDAPFDIEFHDTIGSSNDRARDLGERAARETVVVAAEQTSPRGRSGRDWSSPPGGVWASVLLHPTCRADQVPVYTLAAAVAVARACRETGVDARIKWPNDILVGETPADEGTGEGSVPARGGRKLAGILTESAAEGGRVSWLVLGIGLNANVDPDVLPSDADATSLRVELGRDVDRRRLLQRLLEELHQLRRDLDVVLPAWRDLADTLGSHVRIETADGIIEGEAVDIEFPGALVVRTKAGVERVLSGDCTHLRRG